MACSVSDGWRSFYFSISVPIYTDIKWPINTAEEKQSIKLIWRVCVTVPLRCQWAGNTYASAVNTAWRLQCIFRRNDIRREKKAHSQECRHRSWMFSAKFTWRILFVVRGTNTLRHTHTLRQAISKQAQKPKMSEEKTSKSTKYEMIFRWDE